MTATEGEYSNEQHRHYRMFMPLLLPLDTADRWAVQTDDSMRRAANDEMSRRKNGKPYFYKLMTEEKGGEE